MELEEKGINGKGDVFSSMTRNSANKRKIHQWFFLLPSLLLACSLISCSYTRHTVFPAYGHVFESRAIVMVGVHSNTIIHPEETRLLMGALKNCEVTLLDMSTLKLSEYRSFFDLSGTDSFRLSTVGKETGADYLLLGNFGEVKAPGGLLGISYLNQDDLTYHTERYKPKSVFEIVLYSLSEKRAILTLTTTTKPQTFGFTDKHGSEHWVHPASVYMLSASFKRAKKKLTKLCRC